MARAKKRKFVYREYSEDEILDAVRQAIPEGGRLWDFFAEISMESVQGDSEWERGKCEGRRELAGEILTMAMQEADTDSKVKKNLEEDHAA